MLRSFNKSAALALIATTLPFLLACANPDHYRIDSDPVNAKLQLVNSGEVFTYTLPATIDEIDNDMDIIITKPGYQRFEGKLGDLERLSEKSYRVRLLPLR